MCMMGDSMNDTMIEILHARLERIHTGASQLLRDFSGMKPANSPYDSVVLISASGNQFWNELPGEGKRIQVGLLPQIDSLSELVQVLGRSLPGATQETLNYTIRDMRRAVEQNDTTWWKSPVEACAGFQELTSQITTIINEYFGSPSSSVIAIPDTNALLANPDIESWQFAGVERFKFILAPTILSELDAHKINHKNPDVREKASALIRKFKEYRRRGSLLDGVTVVRNRISIQAIAQEPDMSRTLSWLDSTNADDRFLATALEVIRGHLASQVFIVTLDINMQNKAEMAGIPCREDFCIGERSDQLSPARHMQ